MKLIFLNGPTGVGKSTIAEKLHKELPLSFYINIDSIRRLISGYRKYNKISWELSITAALGITEAQLKQGRDVIIDKMIYRVDILDIFIELGKKYNADTYEFIIWADKKTVLERAEARGYRRGGLLTRKKTEKFWEEINKLKNKRKNAIVIETSNTTERKVFNLVKKYINIK